MKQLFKQSLIILTWFTVILLGIYTPKFITSSPKDRTLNILTWGDLLDPEVIKNFEKKTGIRVHLNFYASNEELLVKMKATQGIGYDLIVPSDYAVALLRSYDLLKKIDKSQLNFLNRIYPHLLNQEYDPGNQYSLPFDWEIFAFGIDQNFFNSGSFQPSWKMLFDYKEINYPIVMTNDPIEAVQFAAFFLFGNKKSLDHAELQQVQNLLIQQRRFIEAYASFRADYFLATRTCPLVISSSSYILRTQKVYPFVKVAIPKEGTFITIENLCITKASQKDEMVYTFLNEIYSQESAKAHYESFCFFPATMDYSKEMELDETTQYIAHLTQEEFAKFHFISELTSQEQIQNLWVKVKSSPSP